MKKLKELIDLISQSKLKSSELFGQLAEPNTKLSQLYNLIQEADTLSDEIACKELYGDGSDKNAYYKIKHTLRNRLLNALFLTNFKDKSYSEIKFAKLECQKYFALYNILITQGARNNALTIAEKGLKIARNYEFNDEAFFFARQLRSHYAVISGSRFDFQKYHQLVENLQQQLLSESVAEDLFYDLLSLYVNDRSTKPHVHKIADLYLKKLKKESPPIQSITLAYHQVMIEIIRFMSINDYASALIVGNAALEKIITHHFLFTKGFVMISLQMIACCIQLKRYHEGEKMILRCLEIVEKGFFTWFKIQELRFMLSFRTSEFYAAQAVFKESTLHKKFATMPANVKEVWKIYEAWLYFLQKSGRIEPTPDSRIAFRVAKYVNEVPTFSKDKRGLNIAVLISQIVLLLQQKKYDLILDRIEAIAKYKDRYMDKVYNSRSNTFICMLLEMLKANFHQNKVIQRTTRFLKKLHETPIEIAREGHDLEILPYEDAWELLVGQLDERGF